MKLKRILALAGALLLVALFVLAIILAVTGAPKNYLMAVIFSMVFIPIIMFAMGLMARVLKPSEPADIEALKAEAEKPAGPIHRQTGGQPMAKQRIKSWERPKTVIKHPGHRQMG